MKSAFLLLLAAAPALAVSGVKIGNHPISLLTPYPSITSLHVHGGRLYMSCGTSEDYYPPVFIVSYDPALHRLRIEHSATTDELTTYRTIGGTLYAAHNDPSHGEDFRDYSKLGTDGIWRDAAPGGCLHVYDFATAGGRLHFCGSKDTGKVTQTPVSSLAATIPEPPGIATSAGSAHAPSGATAWAAGCILRMACWKPARAPFTPACPAVSGHVPLPSEVNRSPSTQGMASSQTA